MMNRNRQRSDRGNKLLVPLAERASIVCPDRDMDLPASAVMTQEVTHPARVVRDEVRMPDIKQSGTGQIQEHQEGTCLLSAAAIEGQHAHRIDGPYTAG